MHKLRIAFLSGGTFTHIGPYLAFFRDRGHEVHWIAYDRPKEDFGVITHDVSRGADSMDPSTKWKYLLAGLSTRRLLRKIQPDLLHGHYVTASGLIALMGGFRPYMLTVHGSDLIRSLRSMFWRRLLRLAFDRAAVINVVSAQLGELAGELGVPADKLLVATLGVDTEQFAFRLPRPPSTPVRLLCTRTLNELYDPQTIVRACALLRERGLSFRLTLAARGSLMESLRQQVAKLGLDDCVSLLGGYANQDLPAMLHEYDAFVSASLSDGTSICLLEAMAAGILPIVSRIPSNQAWLEDGRSGLMFDCGDHHQLAEQILRASADHDLHQSAAVRNRRIVEEHASRQKGMLCLEECYYRLASRGVGA